MRKMRTSVFASIALSWSLVATAQPPATASPATASPTSASPTPAKGESPAKPGSAGGRTAPPLDPNSQQRLPPGHPPMNGSAPSQAGNAMQRDRVMPSANVSPGMIDVMIVDGRGKAVPNAEVVLLRTTHSVAQGDSEQRLAATTDSGGRHIFKKQPTGSSESYKVSASRGSASFVSTEFRLPAQHGVKVLLHAFKPVTSLAESALLMEAVVFLDVGQDTIAVDHLLRTLNIGRDAFVTEGIHLPPLPDGYGAFKAEDDNKDATMVERDGALELVGTFPPGQGQIGYRYHVPFEGKSQQSLRLPLPPRVVAIRVVLGAGSKMDLRVAGFEKAKRRRWHDGKRVLEAVKSADVKNGLPALLANTSPQVLDINITGLPTSRNSRLWGLLLAGLATGVGAWSLAKRRRKEGELTAEQRADLQEAIERLLKEMAALELARESGDVGPKSYQQLRAQLLDAIARLTTQLNAASPTMPDEAKGQPGDGSSTTRQGRRAAAKRA